MDSIRLKNYRCFRDEQTAKLAPLTLLVGDNSTGKTSFLAMVRALWDVFFEYRIPDFKEEPYDLGSYDEIAHHRGGRGGRADRFEAGFSDTFRRVLKTEGIAFDVRFGKSGAAPIPVRTRIESADAWIESGFAPGESRKIQIGTGIGTWENVKTVETDDSDIVDERYGLPRPLIDLFYLTEQIEFKPIGDSPKYGNEVMDAMKNLALSWRILSRRRPFASAPVRSKPRRTYDPSRAIADPEGDYIPMYLAGAFQDKKTWARLKDGLESFGRDAGLFDEIAVKTLGGRESDPFQVQVRKFGGGLKGPLRNLADVGYGVSQALPLITELLRGRGGGRDMFLLQQPEVHLHPSAQAALGSLFCRTAGRNRQLIVETHSDHLMNRVRMDVRDGVSRLKPSDVSILYFQRDGLEVKIHSLGIDGEGNIQNAPNDYRRFFMEETTRSLWRR